MQNNHQSTPPAAIIAASGAHKLPTNLAVAIALAETGIPAYPCAPNKRPLVPGGYKAATTHQETIFQWVTRWPHALAAIPTGAAVGLFVLDVDGHAGRQSLNDLLAKLGLERMGDLSRIAVRTPSGGLHLYFTLRPGELPRSRASDIGPGLDTRGIGGGIIAPGNVLPDGRRYELVDAGDLRDAQPAPRGLLYLATFNDRERHLISETPALRDMIRSAEPHEWSDILQHWRDDEAARLIERLGPCEDQDGYRAQACSDLRQAAAEFAALTDNRRTALFNIACRVAKYVHHGFLSELELRGAFMDAARANGALAKHGPVWAVKALRNALEKSRSDKLPPLAREFRTIKGGRS